MESVDMKKLETAILYLQRIADGNNPVNNMPAEEDAVLNNPNVIRCMYFVKEVLEEVKCNHGYIGMKANKGEKQEFPIETLATFAYREDVTISRLVEQINESIDDSIYRKLTYRPILQWLKFHGFLTEEFSQEFNKTVTLPTEKGSQIGIKAEKRNRLNGVAYMVVIYSRQAQEFIVQNMGTILNSRAETQ